MAKESSKVDETPLPGFFPVSTTKIEWKSRKRSAPVSNYHDKAAEAIPKSGVGVEELEQTPESERVQEPTLTTPVLSERRKAMFEPLEPVGRLNGKRPSAESLLPPPDFDSATYPKGWLIGKKRKLVNVDVVESMRRIAVHEMNRKDREIDGLNEQLDEDARCLEHLQIQLLEERNKRAEAERKNNMLQEQISMLMNMIQEDETMDNGEATDDP